MKILCVSDTAEALIYSKNAVERYRDIDFVISSGDLPLSYYDYIQTVLRKDVYFVYGNHNLEEFNRMMGGAYKNDFEFTTRGNRTVMLLPPSCGGVFIDGRCVYNEEKDLIIAGLGGSMLYNGKRSQYSEKEMRRRISKLVPRLLYNKKKYGRALDILVTHAAPLGVGDGEDLCHMGFQCFIPFVEKYKPKYLLHGHVHLDDINAQRVRMIGDTKVVNVYKSYIIDDDSLGCDR